MHSGLVTLQPGETVGKHSTENKEEAIVVLEGEGIFKIDRGEELNLEKGYFVYCPPHTEHDVLNCGKEPLKYIFIVSKV